MTTARIEPAGQVRAKRRIRLSDRSYAAALMLPAALFLGVFVVLPLARLVIDSLYDISPGIGGSRSFVGAENYLSALGSRQFVEAVARTAVYSIGVVTAELVLGMAAALLFTALGRGSRVVRTVFLYPLMIAPLVAGLLWKFLLIDNFGILNALLSDIGLIADPAQIGWLSDPSLALISVALPDVWLTTSFMALVFFAGLQALPNEVIEAARIDGAGGWSLLRRVVLPLLRPVIAVVLIIRGIDAVRSFDAIMVMTAGGPSSSSETLSLLIYRTMTRFGEPGIASAMSTLYLVAMLVVAVVALKVIWQPGQSGRRG